MLIVLSGNLPFQWAYREKALQLIFFSSFIFNAKKMNGIENLEWRTWSFFFLGEKKRKSVREREKLFLSFSSMKFSNCLFRWNSININVLFIILPYKYLSTNLLFIGFLICIHRAVFFVRVSFCELNWRQRSEYICSKEKTSMWIQPMRVEDSCLEI